MSKITLNPVGSLIDTTTAANTINANSVTVQTAFDNTLSRDGTSPNQMGATLDMNSNRIINLPLPITSLEPVRLIDLATLSGGGTINTLPPGGSASQVLTKNSGVSYDVGWQTPAGGGGSSAALYPQGRLTLTSGQPVMQTDVTASQLVYYAPYTGKTVPTYTGGVWTVRNFTSSSSDLVGLTLNLAGSANWAAGSIHDVFAVMDSGTLKLGTRLWDAGMYPTEPQITNNTTITTGTGAVGWTRPTSAFDGVVVQADAFAARVGPAGGTSNVGMTNCLGQDWGVGVTKILSKVVVTAASDDFLRNDAPAVYQINVDGSNDNVNWHLITVLRANVTAMGGTTTIPLSVVEQQPYRYHRVNLEGNGLQNINVAEVQFYNKVAAANGRRLTLHDGIVVNDAAMTVRTTSSTTIACAQFEGIYLGSIYIDAAAAGQVSFKTSFGTSRVSGVWNYYNRIDLKAVVGSYATSTLYTPPSTQLWSPIENSLGGGFSAIVLMGVAEDWLEVELKRTIYLNAISFACSYEAGIGVDTTSNFSGQEIISNIDVTNQAMGFTPAANVFLQPYAGIRTFNGIERQGNSGAGQISCFTGPRSTYMTVEWRG